MKNIFLLGLILCSQLWADSGQKAWHNGNMKDKVLLLQEYKAFFSELSGQQKMELAPSEELKSSYFKIFNEAWASERPDCIYAGWPSKRVSGFCSSPVRHNAGYTNGNCSGQQLQCQPLLFGKGLCVPVGTKEERNLAFTNCDKKFASAKRTPEEVVKQISSDNKERDLFELMDFADQTCKRGAQAGTGMCARLMASVNRIKSITPPKTPAVTPEPVVAATVAPTVAPTTTPAVTPQPVVAATVAPTVAPTTAQPQRVIPRTQTAGNAAMIQAVQLAQRANEVVKTTPLIDCVPEHEGVPFERLETRPIDLSHTTVTPGSFFDYTFRVDKSGDRRASGFRMKNRGPNEIAGEPIDPNEKVERDWSFVVEDNSKREAYLWITDDAGSGYLSQLMESIILIVPRKMKPVITEVGDELHVTLTTGEKVIYDKKTKKVISGALKEGPVDVNPNRHNRKFADVSYQGSGISIRVNRRGEDPRLIPGSAVITQNGKTCQVPANELWNRDSSFKYADDNRLLELLNRKCAGKFTM